MLKNEVHVKVLKALYWRAKDEIGSTKITSLLELMEKMGVDVLKYFQTRSESVLCKMLLFIGKTIIQDIVVKIKRSNIYGLLTGEVTDISLPIYLTFVSLFHLLNITIITKRKRRQFLLIVQIF